MTRWMKIPPPPLFVFSFLAGVGLERLAALPFSLHGWARVVGIALTVAALLLLASAPLLFLLERTTIVPHRTARRLVTRGPYRITRNPMYLALTLVYAGVALALGHVWSLLFLPLPVWVMHTKVIPFEEATLTRAFGDEYLAYQKRVPRWI
jgi:protein-S-isoprenylcysteine O-methyltransferase Ste14